MVCDKRFRNFERKYSKNKNKKFIYLEKVKQSIRENAQSSKSFIENEESLLATVIEAVSEKKGENIVSLDLKNIEEAVADYFVLCEATNSLQIQAICNNVALKAWENCGEKPYHIQHGDGWTLVDFVNVVIHIFREEERKFYDLEGLWLDGKRKEHKT